ncbi:ABC-2 type transport system ATP-binding protein/lipopolysaccharide transport system ATP-binding protein [Paenibacillus favisporus]|uniref:ABC-2 type transport system ATP-binding protein/lipopolysaccharide transport system ATP-binding protein n=1 Tax=Paenibacillus favisporus TaxID=221028 RepID=A0ABV2F8T1_9BACL
MLAIDVQNVTMKYKLASEKVDSLKYYFIKRLKKQLTYKDFYALQNVGFEVERGEVFGVIGLNGAGKSTLLKVISGILKPTEGKVVKNGSVAPLIELGAGFNGDLTGMENIYLNGLILGYSKKMIESKLDEIIEFSELRDFMHTPLKNYSSGMKSRLGFSIATAVKPDILIVDEVLSVGDIRFKDKSEKKIKNMIEAGTTVLFVSHSLGQVENLCSKVLWLEHGKVRDIGNAKEICKKFKEQQ